MDFELAEEHKLVQTMMRDFANNEILPVGKILEEQHEFPKDLISKIADLGILGMTVPAEFGGIQTDELSFILALEEIGRALASLSVIVSVHCSLFCYAINTFGTPSQKNKYLPPAASGQTLGAFSLTEPGAGSDATQLKTKARKDGDFYVLNGTKSWVTNGREADALILFAKTKNDEEKRMSAFIVEKNTPGLHVTRIEEKLGLHASPTAEISLEDCRIPTENLLGKEDQGASIAFQCLDHSRIGIAAQSVGLAQRTLDEAVKYAKIREAFGTTLSGLQAVQFMIADIATQTEAARLLTYQAALLFEKGKPFAKESSMAKLFASEAANKTAYLALQIHGGYGYSKEYIVEQLYRDARAFTIYEGTSEIQRLVISRYLLKE
ncbi:MAG: acyl-CoA dehydrogenase family protein [Candidatus Aminicenantes bacterium]|nr:acyl-CoA dehydrogenase family protein [Candidatus Aminicenantes bacterium]